MRALALVAMVCAGCSLGAFDDRRDIAWSDSNGEPVGIDGSDFGVAVTTVATGRPGLHLLASGSDPWSLSTISYDGSFGLSSAGVLIQDVPAAQVEPPTIVGSPYNILGADGLVAVGGLGDLGGILLFDARTGANGPVSRGTLECGDLDNLGHAMVFAETDLGMRDRADLVALAGDSIVVFEDLDVDATSHTCHVCQFDGNAVGLSLAAADVGDENGELIFVTTRDTDGTGRQLTMVRGSNIRYHSDNAGLCFTLVTPQIDGVPLPADAAVALGTSIAVGDGGVQNAAELAVAAPTSRRVYVLRSIGVSDPGRPQTLTAAGASTEFGVSMAFGDLDGDDLDELIIGDPGADAQGTAGAGTAFVFKKSEDDEYELAASLHDSTPEQGQRFGRSVAMGELVVGSDDSDQLVVGALGEVFTYFRALVDGTDPR